MPGKTPQVRVVNNSSNLIQIQLPPISSSNNNANATCDFQLDLKKPKHVSGFLI